MPTRLLLAAALMLMLAWPAAPARAEYGDVILNKLAEKHGQRPVIFPHWFHRVRYHCKVCHSELDFSMRATENDVLMSDIINGKLCGKCHNGIIAWGADRCDLCHSGRPGLPSGIIGGDSTGGPGKW